MTPAWDPPGAALVVVGAVGLLTWLALSLPARTGPISMALQVSAAIVLALVLVNAGWHRHAGAARPRLTVLLDRSASMTDVAVSGTTRADEAQRWLEGDSFARLTEGWSVDVDSFGGRASDPAAAIEAASATLPEAILVVSDGRATGGRAIAPAPMPVYARVPDPVAIADAAVLGLAIEEEGVARATIDVGAVGGEPTDARSVSLLVDGAVVARAKVPALAAGERRQVVVDLPERRGEEVVVEARLGEPPDAVAGNDVRARTWRPSAPRRTLLVGLAPSWEIGFLRRALEAHAGGPVDAYWGAVEGTLRGVDGGEPARWSRIDPARYEALWLIGDPALLGGAGRAWVARFTAAGGRGIFWGPAGRGGELAGLRAPPAGASGVAPPAPPALTEAGSRWLEAVVGPLGEAPDGTRAWPPLEALPASPADPPAGATVLLQAGGRPVAWSTERDGNRYLVALGTGWYRLALGAGPERDSPGMRFWRAWTEGAVRWLSAATSAEAAPVILPADGRAPAGEPFAVRRTDATGPLEWRVVSARGGEEAAAGTSRSGEETIDIGPLPAGAWRLVLEAPGRRETRALAVEAWKPDLARTEADTSALGAAVRASGGEMLGPSPRPLPSLAPSREEEAGTFIGLGLVPWAFLLGTALLLGHWAVAARAR